MLENLALLAGSLGNLCESLPWRPLSTVHWALFEVITPFLLHRLTLRLLVLPQ